MIDPISLSQELMRCPSVAPEDAGALDVVEHALKNLGFTCHRLTFEEEGTEPVQNLYARLGDSQPNICFAGHTDVVPVGDESAWTVDPFGAEIKNSVLYGRGASDMKPPIACFITAVERFLARQKGVFKGSISLLITGDEEACAINGTKKVLQWMKEQGEQIDACLVGEPTNPNALGDMIKIGRRGSVGFNLTVYGKQGHSAYPDLADNPIPRLVAILDRLVNHTLDEGNDYFQASNLQITTVDVGNPATNVIPAKAHATFSIRFNTEHSSSSLIEWVTSICDKVGGKYELSHRVTGEAFLTEPGELSQIVSQAVEHITNKKPELSTTGGTSDARFIKDYCPVVEFGLINQTAHKVDECMPVKDIEMLAEIYFEVLCRIKGE